MAQQQQQLQAFSEEYRKIQDELSELVRARQKLESQYTENKNVQEQFSSLSDDTKVYRMIGPVLLKQDNSEAKSTVDSRLKYIEGEIKRVEDSIKSVQERSESKKLDIMRSQQQGGTAE